eukprot:gene33269-38407_t
MVHAYVNTSWRVKDSELGLNDKFFKGVDMKERTDMGPYIGTTPTFGEPMSHYSTHMRAGTPELVPPLPLATVARHRQPSINKEGRGPEARRTRRARKRY